MGDVTPDEVRSRCEAASTRGWAAVTAKRLEREDERMAAAIRDILMAAARGLLDA